MLINDVVRKIRNVKVMDISVYVVFTLFMVFAVHNKVNMHIDELLSYELSNYIGGANLPVEDGLTYYPANTPWLDYMTVAPDARFRYDVVWRNQSNDVHPPLYYAVLHTICSFFPGIFTIWFATLINMVFALGVLFFCRKLVFLLTKDEWVQKLVSIAFVCSAGILSSVTFMRMYIMAMFWVITLTYVVVKQIGEKSNFKLYITIFLCTVCGALTHYYCIVYAVFLSVAYGSYLIYKRQWKEIGFLCLTQGVSAAASIAVFPSMLSHIFSSYRGKESFGNMIQESMSDGFFRISQFWRIIDTDLFGGILIYITCVFVLLFVMNGCRNLYKSLSAEDTIIVIRYICIICPSVLYFLLISRIAVYITDRYMFPVYGVVFVVTIGGICVWCRRFMKEQYRYMLALVLVIVLVSGWKKGAWTYLYQSSEALLETAAEYSDTDCIYVYDSGWKINPSYKEVSNYNSVTFYQPSNLQMLSLSDLSMRYELIVVIMEDIEGTVDEIMNLCPYLNAYEYMGSYGYTDTYHLYIQQ